MASSDAAAPQLSTTVARWDLSAEADFRKAVDSALWLENVQTEKGVLAYGKLSVTQILIQGGWLTCLKFKADIVDEETKAKVITAAATTSSSC